MDDVLAVPAFRDNYIWLAQGSEPTAVAIIDPGDAGPVMSALEHHALRPVAILCTHHHGDHSGGIGVLVDRYHIPAYGPRTENIAGVTDDVSDGDCVDTSAGRYRVLAVPGHTRGHVAYVDDQRLFCGDTLFSAGCGRLFEGTAYQLHTSLMRLAALPDETRVYCGHEYTLANLRFARTVEPDNADILAAERHARRLIGTGQPTLPSTIGEERRINPFLRCGEPAVRSCVWQRSGQKPDTDVIVFAALRRWKDEFAG